MKKIFISLSAGILIIMLSVFSACGFKRPGADNKTYNELKIYCDYKQEIYNFILPVKHKRRDFGGLYIKFKTTSDKETLYGRLKEESTFAEEHKGSLLFLANDENYEYPQYAALTYEGINDKNSKYYDYMFKQQLTDCFFADNNVKFSFPLIYIVDPKDNYSLSTKAVSVSCTFEQLKNYYERLDYAFVAATEDSITVKGCNYKKGDDDTVTYEDRVLLLKYESGTVTASLAE